MTTTTAQPAASLAAALEHAERLLEVDPVMAAEQARAILEVVPRHADTTRVLAAAQRLSGDAEGGLATVAPLAMALPNLPLAQLELALCLERLGRTAEAARAFDRVSALEPRLSEAWRGLSESLELLGDRQGAERALARQLRASTRDPLLVEAATALAEDRLGEAERLLRDRLKADAGDVAAIRMLAETGARLGRYADAEALLTRCMELAPNFAAARHNLATMLYRQNKNLEALAQIEQLVAKDARHPGYANLYAAILARLGEYDRAIAVYGQVLADYPNQPKGWMSYGHALKTVGRQADSVAAYRKALDLAPTLGEVWWSLANLKTVRFTPEDLAAMSQALEAEGLSEDDRLHLHYALGKAQEDAQDWDASFQHYAAGAAIRREQLDYDADENTADTVRTKAVFSPAFIAARGGQGCAAPDPIFVVGLPRSGSTLVEQILASHSLVEGTMELPDLIVMARRLGGKTAKRAESTYPESLAELSPEDLRALGEEFLERTRIQRKTDKPFFIDKMPNNFAHTGLIHLILPNAKIIDARRHPLGCCFSGFKQHFARGQAFSYDLTDIGRYYADYVDLMAHFDAVLPGRVHRVIYERMIADPEAEIRALLDHCGLPFEEACLSPHENDRAVRTASSEQVRRPIFKDAVEHWQKFESHLGPLKQALGPVLTAYPDAPVI
ncbi:tetratricopeptide repeat-containing sulfotransferase family protein [Caulobacter vibrioides]|uniref:TPR domain protein n=2 Tax=Caulobacter vibrioides TaxID=155892 RepID=Q9A3S4_CAUVC|nr:tetratricopeptide repeat-containing sulfotransferase family protein [Caulobacter vibrioides]YP_002518601.1 TPR repeat sulfotransferase family protein [Caulobacter vibrioides NA1000]AAK25090.1 TPR domain protein [Caulobacter vibrioides CB15]ACL96693.1 TPR repeat sulfotransferase family protein [Caulobacter vibrioides NA1000]ATC29954.1 sulfotransferase family protein [Caulobacter vibrioides]QXZ51477.1 sulfotransferase [Caulobacter vibrioides]